MFCECTDIASLDEGELEALRSLLPPARMGKVGALRFEQDRRASTVAWSLLRCTLERRFGIDVNLIELEYGRYGKPHLRSCPGVHFNLSHTRTAVMCAVSDGPVGCDVQRRCELPARDALFERRILHHGEQALIGDSRGDDRRRLLTLFWTLKEAYTKQRGTGLVANIAGYDFSSLVAAYLDTDARKDVPWHARMFGLDFALYERGDCALCACAAHALHWEGQPGFRKTPGNRHGKTLPKSRPED